jgi:NAD(P)-dependent dehydrogenase (short-subunit alcohol dehydrogenase family)
VVTGGTGGIGLATARLLAARGSDPSCIQACTPSEHFRQGILPSCFFGKKEVEKRERNNTQGRAFSADRFTAMHLTLLVFFGVADGVHKKRR